MDNEFLGDRRRALEESYFAKHNRELLERLRAENEARPVARAHSVDNDAAAVQAAADADTKSALLRALSLAPLVAVAWAEDGIDDHERRIVLARATELGLREADAGYRLLERWLAEPPPELLANWKRDYVGGLSLILTHEAKHELKSQILAGARRLAEANDALSGAGRALSDAEQAVLEEIEDAFS